MSSLPVDQHMARVNVSEEQWLEFRALAIREKRSVAAYLGRLVEKEIGRAAPCQAAALTARDRRPEGRSGPGAGER